VFRHSLCSKARLMLCVANIARRLLRRLFPLTSRTFLMPTTRASSNQHDGGDKTVLGQTGPFDGDQVLDILLARPETATFVTTRLWREFVSDTPDLTRMRTDRRAVPRESLRYQGGAARPFHERRALE
jgi:hypothetical protein